MKNPRYTFSDPSNEICWRKAAAKDFVSVVPDSDTMPSDLEDTYQKLCSIMDTAYADIPDCPYATRKALVIYFTQMRNTIINNSQKWSQPLTEKVSSISAGVSANLARANHMMSTGATDAARAVARGTAQGTIEELSGVAEKQERLADFIENTTRKIDGYGLTSEILKMQDDPVTNELIYSYANSIRESAQSTRDFMNSSKNLASSASSSGCYVATAVYGSYDCPQVWTLRRFRDYELAESLPGRAFIKTYYAISPTLVKWFGEAEWFKNMWRGSLDKLVANCKAKGHADTPYEDRAW